ncbi:Addiction module toxin Txe/YoeB [Desulfofarcimen acetoxidans DSM 771]|jgi:Txe/YoeB family toxin of Txe-Axe toxin-antitoxin module|uniref:Endoribonuclease YoeB n=1 Tax=Desulfofarcimen acetoxidans (strain ATCC 49208 / DSM 771 / KCTC 5769 / VKM B-1644 / 5575) TaxID=485916 RepID=C8VZZ9_DESAS|nr:Addiction module toxin Txe/YoeB [Desulfofarcimen acetoxidans DSM 771]
MNKIWSDKSWDDYLSWQIQDKQILKRINELIKDIERNGLSKGILFDLTFQVNKIKGYSETTVTLD